MNEWVSFIHLSDIHFNKYSGDVYDLDEDLRHEIILDIKNNAKSEIGKVVGILLCGDIAFSGKANEYDTALEFLNEVCDILEIPETSVFCVPGNHDVDQETTRGSAVFCNLQENIQQADNSDYIISQYFRDKINKGMLFQHIEEYNKFAGKFRCNINEQSPVWKEKITLNEEFILQVSGLNSIIVSNHKDDDSKLMVLGQHQVPQRNPGTIHMTLCHHPPTCWKDSKNVMKGKMNERVHIQLYGHQHLQKIETINNSLIICSGAAHPVRGDEEWFPEYNWIMMRVENVNNEQVLKVRVYARILDGTETKFTTDLVESEICEYTEYIIRLDDLHNENQKTNPYSKCEETYIKQDTYIDEKDNDKCGQLNIRKLVYCFLSISFIQRSIILDNLKLIEELDEGVEHNVLIDKILKRAQEKGILDEFASEVYKYYNK